ncbi:MAG: zinc metalloprotease HtpX [Mailhella sp.]|nr:zinc metalloprotease HtpX [Mailhella sp.]
MTSSMKTAVLFALLTTLFIVAGGLIGGKTGVIVALFFAVAINFFSYWFSDSIVLRMYKAQELQRSDAPQLHEIVEELARNAGIPKPRICIIPDPSPNAFATGRNPENAVVAVTQGIMHILSTNELRGVIAHEIAHIANRDILIQSCAAVLGSAITSLANMLYFTSLFGGRDSENSSPVSAVGAILMIILAPLAASLIQMAISRSREYAADESGAHFSSDPQSLASALNKLNNYSAKIPLNANPATENMFIVSPLHSGNMQALFSTHPPVEERIKRLMQMAR